MFNLVKYGVPQRSILGPILLQHFPMWFLIVKDIDIASNANGNTPCCTSHVPDAVKIPLKTVSMNVFQWFYNNGMESNIEKCHIFFYVLISVQRW